MRRSATDSTGNIQLRGGVECMRTGSVNEGGIRGHHTQAGAYLMPQGQTGIRNRLQDASERQKADLECLQQSQYFHGSREERFVRMR